MLAGLVLVGAAGYYLLAVAGRTLPAEAAAAVSAVYLLANTAGLGLAMAVEQETSRSVSHALAAGHSPWPAIRAMTRHAALIVAAVAVVLLASAPWLVPGVLNGRWGLLVALLLSVVTFVSMYLVRGILGGHQDFGGYAVVLVTEGITRLIPLVLLDVLHVREPVVYGLVFAGGGLFGTLVALPWLRRLDRAPAIPGPAAALGRSFGLLLSSAMLAQVMANIAPVIAIGRLPADAAVGAALAAAFVLARIPLFVFSPVQTILLPRLVTAVAKGDTAGVRRALARALGAVGALGVAGIAGSALLGPWILETFFGVKTPLPGWMLPVLAAGTVLMMGMQVLQPALLAAGKQVLLLGSWLAGCICMLATALLIPQAAEAAVIAQLLGSAVVVVVATLANACGRGGARAHAGTPTALTRENA